MRTGYHFSRLVYGMLLMALWQGAGNCGEAVAGSKTPPLHVDGKYLKDPDGNVVRLQGVHTTPHSYFTGKGQFWKGRDHAGCLKYMKRTVDTLTDPSPRYGHKHGWHANQIRIGSANSYWSTRKEDEKHKGHDRSLDMAAFKETTEKILVPLIKYAETKGVYIVLFPGVGIPVQSTTPRIQKKLLDAWGYWSTHPDIKNAPNVHFEICNEPIKAKSKRGKWGGGKQEYHDGLVEWLQPIVDMIRKNGANNVIWIPGLSYQSQYAGFAKNPVKGKNVGYAIHVYPAYGGMGDNPEKIRKYWKKNYMPVVEKYPVNITEMLWKKMLPGDNKYWKLFNGVTGNETSGFGTAIHDILKTHKNISWVVHLTGAIWKNADPEGELNHIPERDNCALPAFKWFYEFRN